MNTFNSSITDRSPNNQVLPFVVQNERSQIEGNIRFQPSLYNHHSFESNQFPDLYRGDHDRDIRNPPLVITVNNLASVINALRITPNGRNEPSLSNSGGQGSCQDLRSVSSLTLNTNE